MAGETQPRTLMERLKDYDNAELLCLATLITSGPVEHDLPLHTQAAAMVQVLVATASESLPDPDPARVREIWVAVLGAMDGLVPLGAPE